MTTTPYDSRVRPAEREEQIVDFSPLPLTGLSLFSFTFRALLKGSGDVMTVSPIVFDGTIIPSIAHKKGRLSVCRNGRKPWIGQHKFRQCQAAQRCVLTCSRQRQAQPTSRLSSGPARIGTVPHAGRRKRWGDQWYFATAGANLVRCHGH
jgi:hypothetical protein